jgi:hypothetical protein
LRRPVVRDPVEGEERVQGERGLLECQVGDLLAEARMPAQNRALEALVPLRRVELDEGQRVREVEPSAKAAWSAWRCSSGAYQIADGCGSSRYGNVGLPGSLGLP